MSGHPFLSVVIPVYNRERELRRVLESCVSQQNADFEVIVVDDGSRDGSAAVAAGYAACGVRLIRHEVNRGSSPARNTGFRSAVGEWIVRVDSDDELLPGALEKLQRHAQQASPRTGRIGLMYRYLDGRASPFPIPTGEVLDYEGFLSWLEHTELWDTLVAYRRRAFARVPLPEGRLMEMLHFLDFAKEFDTCWYPDPGALYHIDACERQSKGIPAQEEARQNLEEIRMILQIHGDAMARYAPRLLGAQRRKAIVSRALAGERHAAVHEAFSELRSGPAIPLNWALVVSVLSTWMLGRRPMELALDLKWWLVEHRRILFCKVPPLSSEPSISSLPGGSGPCDSV